MDLTNYSIISSFPKADGNSSQLNTSFIQRHKSQINRLLHKWDSWDEVSIRNFHQIVYHLSNSKEETTIFWVGIGKSQQLASLLADLVKSIGYRSIALDGTNSLHGDIGMIRGGDIVILVSKSGNTAELVSLVPYLQKKQIFLWGIFGSTDCCLASECDLVLILPMEQEIAMHNLIPSTSAISYLFFGNLLIEQLIRRDQLSLQEYQDNHPAGSIGKKTWKVAQLMKPLSQIPVIIPDETILNVMLAICQQKTGCALVVDSLHQPNQLAGIVTDGDIRRHLSGHSLEDRGNSNQGEIKGGEAELRAKTDIEPRVEDRVARIMNREPIVVHSNWPLTRVLLLLEQHPDVHTFPVMKEEPSQDSLALLGYLPKEDLLRL